jgi:hypothetical protein
MDMKSAVLDKLIKRIREACGLVGHDLAKAPRDLETCLEGLVADGEDNEGRLTVAGLTFLSKSSSSETPIPSGLVLATASSGFSRFPP